MVLEIKEKLYIGDLSPLSTLLQKSSNWSMVYNLRNPLKTSFPGYPRDIGTRPQYKKRMRVLRLRLSGSRSFQCFSRQANGEYLGIEARRLEGAGLI
jgi:hypothetical protein